MLRHIFLRDIAIKRFVVSDFHRLKMGHSNSLKLNNHGITINDVRKRISQINRINSRNYRHTTSFMKNSLSTMRTKDRFKSTKADENTLKDNMTTDISKGIYIKTMTKVKDVYYENTEDVAAVKKLFRSPKSVLHNYFQAFQREDNKTVELSPRYKLVGTGKTSEWICTYHISWPEEIRFHAKDHTKKDSSLKAALAALSWLKSQGKLADNGSPIINERKEVKQMIKKSIPTLNLSSKTIENIENLVAIYENDLYPKIQRIESDSKLNTTESEDNVSESNESIPEKTQVRNYYIDKDIYMAKEKLELPISSFKAQFMNLLKNHQIIIVRGQPGCGKSTRIPQYILESLAREEGLLQKSGIIAVTQPRRIAAISLAERVANERNESVGNIVGYQVRLNSNFNSQTGMILYCTTGILLRNLQSDPSLSKYSHIILDEAHERDVNTDLLMNLIKTSLKNNPNLKLIVMSATIDTDMLSKYFDDAVVMDVPGFTYPVKEHFLDDCKLDVSKTRSVSENDSPTVVHEEVVNILQYIHESKPEGAILCFLPGWEDISRIYRMLPRKGDLVTYCLHSRLHDSEQWKIFSKPPPGVRKIILATNIAETSVTIDDVVYVVDTGIQKDLRFDVEKGVNCIDNHWISKANAKQRKGRAGRVQAGESYHLYTKERFNLFNEYAPPEIQTTSLNKIVLDCKVFSNNMDALEFMSSLPTPPDESATVRAVNELTELELLDSNEKLTPLGRTISEFQLEPQLSKAMINSVIFGCVTPIIDIVTLFSAETEFFVSGLIDKEEVKQTKKSFCSSSDHLAMMRLFEKWILYDQEEDQRNIRNFCAETNIVPSKMKLVGKLRNIHFGYLYDGLNDVLPISDDMSDNDEMVKAVLFSGVGKVLQHRNWDYVKNKIKNNVNVFITRNNHKATISSESVNFKRKSYPTDFLMYINETRSNIRRTTLVRECSLIPSISVLLFSNKKLKINDLTEIPSSANSENMVELELENTSIKMICDRKQAEKVIQLKNAIESVYQYYIKQMTEIGVYDGDLNSSWFSYVKLLGELLEDHSIAS